MCRAWEVQVIYFSLQQYMFVLVSIVIVYAGLLAFRSNFVKLGATG